MATRMNPHQPKPRKRISDAVRKLILDATAESVAGILDDPVLMGDGNEAEPTAEGDDDGGNHVHVHLHGADNPLDGGVQDAPSADPPGGAVPPEGGDPAQADPNGPDPLEARLVTLEAQMQQILQKLGDPAEQPTADDEGGFGGLPKPVPGVDGEDPDPKPKIVMSNDSAALEVSYRATVADAEILVPGFVLPTFDARTPRAKTIDGMCVLRRRALDHFSNTVAGRETLGALAQGKTYDLATLDCKAVAQLFRSAAGVQRLANNRAATGDAGRVPVPLVVDPTKRGPQTIADLNALHQKLYH